MQERDEPQPIPGQSLRLSASGFAFDSGYQTVTDAQGRFAFENVPPGSVTISRLVKLGARAYTFSHGMNVLVQPGGDHDRHVGRNGCRLFRYTGIQENYGSSETV